jgi:hypothetical protein
MSLRIRSSIFKVSQRSGCNVHIGWLLTLALLLPGGFIHATPGDDFQRGMLALQRGDYAEAYCLLKPLAEQGDVESQYNIGWLYANGNGMRVDMNKAIEWWKRAATKGYVDAEFALGLAYTTGDGIKADKEEAVKWYLKAGTKGNGEAQDILRSMLAAQDEAVLAHITELAGQEWLGVRRKLKGDDVNCRAKPDIKGEVIATLEREAEVVELDRQEKWVQVLLPGTLAVGWIYSKLLDQ